MWGSRDYFYLLMDSIMTPRTCLGPGCGKTFLSDRPKSQHRICPDCDKKRPKTYGKTSSSGKGKRAGKSVNSGVDSG